MGMAASQARFLGLTARKTNVEFEGQQINQQRTTLANQSANYYNQLLGMSVPTPPSTSDYTKTTYTFTDGNLSNSITALVAQSNGTYMASYVSSWTNDFTPVASGNAVINRVSNDEYDYIDIETNVQFEPNGTTYNLIKNDTTKALIKSGLIQNPDKIDEYMDDQNHVKYVETESTTTPGQTDAKVYALSYKYTIGSTILRTLGELPLYEDRGDDPYLKTLTEDQYEQLRIEEQNYEAMLDKKYGDSDWLVRYTLNSSDGTYSPTFYNKSVVKNAIYNEETGISQSNIQSYKIGSATETEEVKGKTARLEKDSSGRYINITLYDDEAGTENPVTYSLTTNTVTDQAAYDDAMNQYEYNKYKYDQSIEEINAQIEIVQEEDKSLELRLKQLDTEQEAIQQEIDSVTKVVEKNIEKSFNSFA